MRPDGQLLAICVVRNRASRAVRLKFSKAFQASGLWVEDSMATDVFIPACAYTLCDACAANCPEEECQRDLLS